MPFQSPSNGIAPTSRLLIGCLLSVVCELSIAVTADSADTHQIILPAAIDAKPTDPNVEPPASAREKSAAVEELTPAPGEEVDSAQNAGGVRDDGIGVGRAQIHRGQPLHDFIHDIGRSLEARLERGFVGNPGAVGIGNRDAAFSRELRNLQPRAMNKDDLDAQ